jgi:hypothetical protein
LKTKTERALELPRGIERLGRSDLAAARQAGAFERLERLEPLFGIGHFDDRNHDPTLKLELGTLNFNGRKALNVCPKAVR